MMKQETAEHYLRVILQLKKRYGAVRAVQIADELHVSRPTVCVALKELKRCGYAYDYDDHEIRLTQYGEQIASAITERCSFMQMLLTVLGVDPEVAEKDANLLGHDMSDVSYDALRSFAMDHLAKKLQKQ